MSFVDRSFVKNIIFDSLSAAALQMGAVLAHEHSHMLAMHAFFTNINTYIHCPFASDFICYAGYRGNPVLRPEVSISKETADGIISAAGPISDIAMTGIFSILGWKMRRSNCKISSFFFKNALGVSVNSFIYALSTLGSKSGDFAEVEAGLGISHKIQTLFTGAVALSTALLARYSA